MDRRRKDSRSKSSKRKTRHSKDDALSETELQKLIETADNRFDRAIVVLSGYEGMRSSEIAHMTKDWVDFQDDTITIPEEQNCNCSECIVRKKRLAMQDGASKDEVDKIKKGIWMPKTENSARMIPIRNKAKQYIHDYFNAFDDIGCSRVTVFNHIKDIAKRSKITKKIYPHSLRSTSASLWGLTGISATALCKIMGWSDIETAYSYVNADMESAVQEGKWRDNQTR